MNAPLARRIDHILDEHILTWDAPSDLRSYPIENPQASHSKNRSVLVLPSGVYYTVWYRRTYVNKRGRLGGSSGSQKAIVSKQCACSTAVSTCLNSEIEPWLNGVGIRTYLSTDLRSSHARPANDSEPKWVIPSLPKPPGLGHKECILQVNQ